jgi:ribosome-associated protein
MKADPGVLVAARAALEKKAEGISLLDLRGLSDVTDYFLVCHGRSSRQVQSIAENIEMALKARRRRPGHVEGRARAEWILMDYYDFVVHIFTMERRAYYGLEKLWADAPRLRVPGRAPGRSPVRSARRAKGAGDDSEESGAFEEE